MALHGLVARDDVLGIAGQQVAIVRQAVRKRRAVEEHELVLAVIAGRTAVDGLLESVVLIPVVEHGLLQLGEAWGSARRWRSARRQQPSDTHDWWIRSPYAPRLAVSLLYPYEDDDLRAIAARRHRGTTSLAALPRFPSRVPHDRLTFGCSGRSRRFYWAVPCADRSSGSSPLITDHCYTFQHASLACRANEGKRKAAWRPPCGFPIAHRSDIDCPSNPTAGPYQPSFSCASSFSTISACIFSVIFTLSRNTTPLKMMTASGT